MSGRAPEGPDPAMEDTFAECFGENLNATEMNRSEGAGPKDASRDALPITPAARSSETQISGGQGWRRNDHRQSSTGRPTVSDAIGRERNAIPISGSEATQAQGVPGMWSGALPNPCPYLG